MSKTVVVTGLAGFIGAHLCEHILKNTDWNIAAIDRLTYAGNLNRLTQMDCWEAEHKRVHFYYHDLRSFMQTGQILVDAQPHKVDYFIHMAAESHVGRSFLDPMIFAESNVIGAVNALEMARVFNVEKFIQVSTDEVYGAVTKNGKRHLEGEPHRPSNPYAASKAGAEDFAHAFWNSFGLPVVISNTMNNFGERQDPEKFVPKTIKAIRDGHPVTIHVNKDEYGEVVDISSRCWLHARNHADALLFLLEHGVPGERYNIVGEWASVFDVATMIAVYIGKPALNVDWVDFHSYNRGHDMHYGLDGSKMAALGWQAPFTFAESLERTVKWTLDHKEWLP